MSKIKEFDSDVDFIEYCIDYKPKFIESEDYTYYTFEHTQEYLDDLKNGIKIKIKDPDSRIKKNKGFSYRLVTFDIENLI